MTDSSDIVMNSKDLLVELGCEELPPKALDGIRDAFFNGVKEDLEKNNIEFDRERSRAYSTPRRLALYFSSVASSQPDQDLERRGPAVKAAFDQDGKPTGAAIGFARSVGKEVSELETLENDKGQWLYARVHQPGRALADLIYPILEQAINKLPVPKPMRWGDHDFSFVRPVHWLVVMHGSDVIDGQLFGLEADNLTRGHRVHAPGPHVITNTSEYCGLLMDAFVMADHEIRKSTIQKKLLKADPNVHIDPSLLSEVNNLVEWPVAVNCTFDKEFLEVPHAALIASMQDHQKFFPVLEKPGSQEVSNRFVAISNIESTHELSVKEGYERVIRPRLADARFFLEQDSKHQLEFFLPLLDRVVFQNKIGTVGDKTVRMSAISANIADLISADIAISSRAARLSKCDLMSQMVGEFPELQGLMGQYYALKSGEPDTVSQAIGEHYAPRFAGDQIPASLPGKIVSLSDRIDTIVGIFAAGLRPTGNKDPFALRRSALGLVRILVEARMELPLIRLLAFAANELSEKIETSAPLLKDIEEFIVDRLKNYYRDKGHGAELISAALASEWTTLPDLDRRLIALSAFMGQQEASSLAAANKRIGNILRKSSDDVSMDMDETLLLAEEEQQLFAEISRLEAQIEPLLERGDYEESLKMLAALKNPVDSFFDAVMVMDDDMALRNNRLTLLARLKSLFDRIADLSVLA